MLQITVLGSASRPATFNGEDIRNSGDMAGIKLYLDVTAITGTLDVKLQSKDLLSGKYFDIAGASFSQKSGVLQDDLILSENITPIANRAVSQILPDIWRVVCTIVTGPVTFSLGGVLFNPNS